MKNRNMAFSTLKKFLIMMLIMTYSCSKPFEYYEYDYYGNKDRPDPVFAQISEVEDFSIYASAIEKFPEIKEQINTAGLYTAFVPTNQAFEAFFQQKGISSIDDMDEDELRMLVNYHLVYNSLYRYDFWYEQAGSDLIKGKEFTYEHSAVRYETQATRDTIRISAKNVYNYFNQSWEARTVWVRRGNKYINIYTRDFLELSNSGNYLSSYEDIWGVELDIMNINGSPVDTTYPEYDAENGVLHALQKVVDVPPSVDQMILSGENTQSFARLMERLQLLYFDHYYNPLLKKDSIYQLWYGDKDRVQIPLANEDQVYTVFVPRDNVMEPYLNNLTINYDGDLKKLPDAPLTALLHNHIFDGIHWPIDLDFGVTSINGSIQDDNSLASKISSTIISSNGIIYLIDEILEPDEMRSVIAPVQLTPELKLFSIALDFTGLTYTLRDLKSEFTVLAVTNSGFENSGITYDSILFRFKLDGKTMTYSKLNEFISYHIIRGSYNIDDLSDQYYETYVNMWLKSLGDGSMQGDNPENIVDIDSTAGETENGFVHVVNEFLYLPGNTLLDILKSDSKYASFLGLLEEYDLNTYELLDQNQSRGDYYTAFVPSATAIESYVPDAGITMIDLIRHHVVKSIGGLGEAPLFVEGTESGEYLSLAGDTLTINTESGLQVNGFSTSSQTLGITGVVHYIGDNILIPGD
jgi:uncharacterized surface protein with fasciclin (FAS1) repeats